MAFRTAFITIFFDCTLALGCFFGIGLVFQKVAFFKNLVLAVGFIIIIYMGISIIRSIPQNIESKTGAKDTLWETVSRCFFVTWLNPQAIIDGTLLLGGIRASLADTDSNFFIVGTVIASFFWFSCLVAIVSLFKHKLNHRIFKLINFICGLVILMYGVKLGYNLLVMR